MLLVKWDWDENWNENSGKEISRKNWSQCDCVNINTYCDENIRLVWKDQGEEGGKKLRHCLKYRKGRSGNKDIYKSKK